jgi:hypothetical protein
MTEDIFDELKTDIMMILTRESGHSFSERELYSKLLIERDIKDPIEKDNLKTRFLIIFRLLSSLYPNKVELKKINGVLKATFDPSCIPDYSANSKDINIEETKDYLEEETKDQNFDMPSEISVIQFIVDQQLEKFYSRRDYEGNTILHKLVLYNDVCRFKKVYLHKDLSLSDKNNNEEKPTDLIKDIRFHNLLITQALDDIQVFKHRLKELDNRLLSLDKDYCKLYFNTLYITNISILLFSLYFIKYMFG